MIISNIIPWYIGVLWQLFHAKNAMGQERKESIVFAGLQSVNICGI